MSTSWTAGWSIVRPLKAGRGVRRHAWATRAAGSAHVVQRPVVAEESDARRSFLREGRGIRRSEPDDHAAHGALFLHRATGCERRETLHEVLAVPIEDARDAQRVAVDAQSFRAREIAPRRLVELRVERLGAVRLRRKRRTADRRTVDCEVNARLLELAPQDLVLDVVERHLAAGRPPAHRRPDAVDLADAVSRPERQPGSSNRVVIDDRA